MKLCACGCGEQLKPDSVGRIHTYVYGHHCRRNKPIVRQNYVFVLAPGHPRSKPHHCRVQEHILIAEKALGKYLPSQAEVHHFDGNRSNNVNTNLVICEDIKYHHLLHRRQRIVDAGGDPNTQQICSFCKGVKDYDQFHKSRSLPSGYQRVCIPCTAASGAKYYQAAQKRKSALAFIEAHQG